MIYLDFATGFNLPPYWLNHPQVVQRFSPSTDVDPELRGELLNVPHACPLSIWVADEGIWWDLPIEPVVSISGKNIIARRNVLKQGSTERARGTIKEVWSQDDYEITIAGLLVADRDGEMPEKDIRRLRKVCERRDEVPVMSPLFELFNITRMAIESYELPFTKGIENQMFTIKGYSDELFDLVADKS